MQPHPPPLPGDQSELMFPHTGGLVGLASLHPSTTDMDSTQLPNLSNPTSSTTQEQRSSSFIPHTQPVAQIAHSSALVNKDARTVPSLLQLANQHCGKGSDTFSIQRTSFSDTSTSSFSLSEMVTHATPSPHAPRLAQGHCEPSDSHTSQPSSVGSSLSKLAAQHVDNLAVSCINSPMMAPGVSESSPLHQGGTTDAHTAPNTRSQLSLSDLASQNVINVAPSLAPDVDQGPIQQSSNVQLATLRQQHLNESTIKQSSQSKPRPPTSNKPVTTTATNFAFSPFGDSKMTPEQPTGLSLADLARMQGITSATSRSTPPPVSSSRSSATPSLSSLVKSHLAVEACDTDRDGSSTKDPCLCPSTASLPTSSPPLSTLPSPRTHTVAADLSKPSDTHTSHLSMGSSPSCLATQQLGEAVPTPITVAMQETLCDVTHPATSLSDHKSLSLSQLAQLHHSTSTITQQHSVALLGSALGDMTLKQGRACAKENSSLFSSMSQGLPQDKNLSSLTLTRSPFLSPFTQITSKVTFYPQHKQNRLFALTMCRSRAQQRKAKHISKLRRSILKQLAKEFVSKCKFDFSTPSPDDVVKEKQKKGFK